MKEVALRWFISYLSTHTQVCKVGRTYSSKKYIKAGIPQRSNLGPLLFLLYFSDLQNCLNNSIPALFADDTNTTVSGSSIEDVKIKLNVEFE